MSQQEQTWCDQELTKPDTDSGTRGVSSGEGVLQPQTRLNEYHDLLANNRDLKDDDVSGVDMMICPVKIKITPGTPVTDTQEAAGCPSASDPLMTVTGLPQQQQPDGQTQQVSQVPPAPDGGYGWWIVLGCFLSHILIGGIERSEGIYFLQFQERYQKSAQLTAWPGALVSALRLCLGPFVGAICNRYSVRSATLIGSVILFIGIVLNGVSQNFYFLFFSHFLVQGIGRGFVYAPGIILVGMYFDKRRGLAAGLGSAGVGVGTFLLVPLTQLFFDVYNYEGAFLILGAIVLNTAVSAMLYRPLSLHFKFTRGKENKEVDQISLQEAMVLTGAQVSDSQSVQSWKVHHHQSQSSRLDISNPDNEQLESHASSSHKKLKGGCLKSSLKIFFPVESRKLMGGGSKKKNLINFSLLKNPSFLLLCIGTCLFTAAFKSAFTFIPALVKSHGFSDSEAAMVLSITGIVDMLGRISFGFLFDLKLIKSRRPIVYTLFLFLIAGVSFILPNLSNYFAICLVCSVYGLLTGGYVSQKSVISVDIVGIENIANSFGLVILFQGIGVCVGPPLSGALKDLTGSFILSFYLGGALMTFAGFLLIFSNIFLHRQRLQMGKTKNVINN